MEKQDNVYKTTIGEFFTWYSGSDEWYNDIAVTNTMVTNDTHTQDDGEDGWKTMRLLKENKDVAIEVMSYDDVCAYDIEFTLYGVEYSLQSICEPFDESYGEND